jgi:hypothetical protein
LFRRKLLSRQIQRLDWLLLLVAPGALPVSPFLLFLFALTLRVGVSVLGDWSLRGAGEGVCWSDGNPSQFSVQPGFQPNYLRRAAPRRIPQRRDPGLGSGLFPRRRPLSSCGISTENSVRSPPDLPTHLRDGTLTDTLLSTQGGRAVGNRMPGGVHPGSLSRNRANG